MLPESWELDEDLRREKPSKKWYNKEKQEQIYLRFIVNQKQIIKQIFQFLASKDLGNNVVLGGEYGFFISWWKLQQ